jgi:hypothetical protein
MTQSVAPIITARVPAFIQDQYPAFAQFIADYFEWLESDADPNALPGSTPNYLAVLNNWSRNLDPSTYNVDPSTDTDPYLNAILKDLGFALQRELAVPKAMLLSSLRDFYLSRGSVQSFQYLFKLLFGDSSISITYPRDKMLVLSQANYGETNYIFLELDSSDLATPSLQNILSNAATIGGTATGSVSKLTAFVEDASIQHYTLGDVLRLTIAKPNGEFDANDQVTVTVGNYSFSKFILNVVVPSVSSGGTQYQNGEVVQISGPNLYTGSMKIENVSRGSVEDIEIIDGGLGYAVNDIIRARPANNIYGRGFSAYVTAVTPDGGIAKAEVFDPGYDYDVLPSIYVTHIVPKPAPPVGQDGSWYFKPMSSGESLLSPTATQDPKSPIYKKPVFIKAPNQPVNVKVPGYLPVAVDPYTNDLMYTTTLIQPPHPSPVEIREGTNPFTIPFWSQSGEYAFIVKMVLASMILPGPAITQVGEVAIAYVTTGGHTAKILGFTNSIGQITAINTDQPYLILGSIIPAFTLNIASQFGSGATLTYATQTRFTVKGWVDQVGFLGVNSVITDSNKYQQFSYQIETQEDPDLYLDVVDDLLHPVGYMRFTVASRSGSASLNTQVANAQVVIPPVVTGLAAATETAHDVVIESISEASDILAKSFTNKLSSLTTESGDSITFQ